MTCVTAVGLFAGQRLAFPATELIEDGWPTAPVGASPAMRAQPCNLIPALHGLSPRQLKGLCSGGIRLCAICGRNVILYKPKNMAYI
jgi:hypothetical protein